MPPQGGVAQVDGRNPIARQLGRKSGDSGNREAQAIHGKELLARARRYTFSRACSLRADAAARGDEESARTPSVAIG